MLGDKHKRILEALAQSSRADRLLIFIGAGVSRDYGLPNWVELAEQLGVSAVDSGNLPDSFSEYVLRHGKLGLDDFLESKLGLRPAEIRPATRLLLELRCVALVSTNCDRIIETAMSALGVPYKVFLDDHDLSEFHTTPWLKLIKFHGSLDRKETLVFTREEYASHEGNVPGLRLKVAELIRYCSVLFIGYSLADPDLRNLMQLVAAGGPAHLRQMVGFFPQHEIRDGWRKLYLNETIRRHAPLLEISFDDFGSDPASAVTSFLHELRELVSPKTLPLLERQCVIFTNGYTTTLKTELCGYLANCCLGIRLFATHRYGRCTVDGILDIAMRNTRYDMMLNDAARAVEEGVSVILDGTFSKSEWRTPIYEMAHSMKARVIVIKTLCEDEAYIRMRLWRRRLDHSRSEHEVTDFANFQVTRKAVVEHPVESDSGLTSLDVDFITFKNHGDRSITLSHPASKDAQTIGQLMRVSPFMSSHI